MSFIINTPIVPLCFQSDLARVELSVQGAQPVEVVLEKGWIVFANTYYPDESGKIILYDLDKVVDPYLDRDNPMGNAFTLSVGSESVSLTVIPCSAVISESAADFLPDFFLTPMMKERDTCIGRFETVTAYAPGGTEYSVLATYHDGEGLHHRQFDGVTSGDCSPIDVSPEQYVDGTLGTLVSYVVHCGKRKAKYRVLPYMPWASTSFLFRNCFGAWETIHLSGTRTLQPKYTRSTATVNGRLMTYDIKEEALYEVQTGPMRSGLEAVAYDLARAKKVYELRGDGECGAEYVITDCDTKTTDDGQAPAEMKFTFRRASNLTFMVEATRPPRIFDKHFDTPFE